MDDKARYEWLKKNIFESKWDGTIGRPPRWVAHGAARKLAGYTLEEAIDNAIADNLIRGEK